MDDTSSVSAGRRDRNDTGDDSVQPPRQKTRIESLQSDDDDSTSDDSTNEDMENEIYDLPLPILNSSSNRRTIERTQVVGLNSLSEHGAEPQMDKAIVLQLIRLIPHNPHTQNGNAQTYSRPRSYGPVRPSSMPCTRVFMCVPCIF